MNKIHTLKWSRLLSAWVVVSEIASSVGGKAKRTCRHRARTLLQAGLVIGMVGMPLTWVVAAPSLNVNNIKVTKLTPVVDAKLEVPNLNVGTELSVSYSFSENHPTETRKDKSRYWWHYAKDKLSAEDLRAEIKDKGTEVASGVIPPRKITPEDVSAKSDLELSILPEVLTS